MSAMQEARSPVAAHTSPLSDKAQIAAVICGCVVAFAYSANYTNHAPLAPALMREFGFNNALAGLLTTGIFATHAGMQIPGGFLVDRLGSRRVLLFALIWVALGNFGMAIAGAYWQLLFFKIFTGMGTGVCFVGGARYVHEATAGPRLHVAQGFFGGSIQLGAGFVILAVPRLNLLAGWRMTFIVSAGMVLVAAVIWLAGAPTVEFGARPPGHFHEMLLAPQLWFLGLMQMATFGISVVVGSWVSVVLIQNMKVPPTRAGLIGSLVLLLGIVSRPLGGFLRRHMGIRPLFIGSLADGCAGLSAVRTLNNFSGPRFDGSDSDRNWNWTAIRRNVFESGSALSRQGRGGNGAGQHAGHHHDFGRSPARRPSEGLDWFFQGKFRGARRILTDHMRDRAVDRP